MSKNKDILLLRDLAEQFAQLEEKLEGELKKNPETQALVSRF